MLIIALFLSAFIKKELYCPKCRIQRCWKKVPFLAWLKRNAERRRSCYDWFRSSFLNTVLLNWFIKDLTQIYGQSAILGWFVRKQNAFYGQTDIFQRFVRKFWAIMLRIYGQKAHFHRLVRKRQIFCQMQCSLNQHTKLPVKFTAKLFWVISIIEGNCHACAKKRIRFAIDCKSSGFSTWGRVFPILFPAEYN